MDLYFCKVDMFGVALSWVDTASSSSFTIRGGKCNMPVIVVSVVASYYCFGNNGIG